MGEIPKEVQAGAGLILFDLELRVPTEIGKALRRVEQMRSGF